MRVQQHPDRNEKEHRKRVTQRQRLGCGSQTVVGSTDDQAGQERSERHRDAERDRGSDGNTESYGKDREREELAREGRGYSAERPRNRAVPQDDRQCHESRHLGDRHENRPAHVGVCRAEARQRGHQHENQNREEILDDEPSDGDVSGQRLKLAVIRQHADQDHRAGYRQRQPKHDSRAPRPPQATDDRRGDHGRAKALDNRTGNSHALHGKQLSKMELQSDAEHEQHDADLRELVCDLVICHETGGMRADEMAGEEVADNGGQSEALRDVAKNHRGAQAGGQSQD